MKLSYGFIETQGLIAAIEAADVMLKTAKVELLELKKVGSALVTVTVKGNLDACQAAVAAGKISAEQVGELVSAHVIPRPFDDTIQMVSGDDEPEKPVSAPKEIKSPPKLKTSVRKKSAKPKKQTESKPHNLSDSIINTLKNNPGGLTLQKIAEQVKLDSTQARIHLKKLMDSDTIEKIQQRYFWIKKTKKK